MNPQDTPILKMTDVVKRYPDAGGAEGLPVLDGLTLSVRAGESLAIVGPSGSGKSTLLNLAGALDRPTAGSVRMDGRELEQLSDAALAVVRSRHVGFVFQMHHLLPQCTVLENVLIPTLAAGADRSGATRRAGDLLARVGLAGLADRLPATLSGGERQRVAVARALINRPRILLADEPTGSLDRASADTLTDLLTDLNRADELTLIVVTHSEALARRMGRVLHLSAGRLDGKGGGA